MNHKLIATVPAWSLGNYPRVSWSNLWTWGIASAGLLFGVISGQFGLGLVSAGVVILGLGPLFIRLDKRTVPGLLFGPASIVYLYHAMGYALGPMAQYYIIGYFDPNIILFESGFTSAQWGCVLGLLTFALVYPLIFNSVSKRISRDYNSSKETDKDRAGYGILLLGIAAFIVIFGYYSGAGNRLARLEEVNVIIATIHGSFQQIHLVMFYFLGFSAARLRGGWIIFWLLIYLAYALFFLLDGSRGVVVNAGIISAMGWTFGGCSRKKVFLVFLVAAFVFIPIAGIVNTYRSAYIGESESVADRLSGLSLATGDFAEGASAKEYGIADIFFQRVTTHSVDRVFMLTPSEIPFAGFEGIEDVIYAFVPRLINPERPVLLDGTELAIRYGAAPIGLKFGAYMPAVGDGYRRFGWAGIALLYAFCASIFGALTALTWCLRGRREWMAMCVFVTISASEIMISTLLSSFYTLLWVMPKYIFFFWSMRWMQDRAKSLL
jgi:hypothetical protein